jgi:hypothetical protein
MNPAKITAKVETIDPKTARKYLASMGLNRKPKEATVAQYCNDMVTGKWLLSPQGIAFDEEGRLFEGQHRMLAIIRGEVPVQMLVLRGFPVTQQSMKTMDVVDSGVGRSLADRLKLMGCYHGNPNLASAAARQIAGIVMGTNCRAARKLSISGVVEILRIWKHEMHAVCSVLDRPQFRNFRNGHTIAAFTVAAVADLKALDRDMGRITTGANLDPDSPLLELRNLYFGSGDLDRREKTNLTLAALYCAWMGKPAKAFHKSAVRTEAADFFRSAQEDRYAQVAALFFVGESTK